MYTLCPDLFFLDLRVCRPVKFAGHAFALQTHTSSFIAAVKVALSLHNTRGEGTAGHEDARQEQGWIFFSLVYERKHWKDRHEAARQEEE